MASLPNREFTAEPAKRERVPLLIGLTGPSGSGKTYSALRLATGIQQVSGGDIFFIDTESRRALHYADKFKFRHVPFDAANEALEDKRNELATCEAQHAVTRQSVSTLESVIEDLNNRALARGEAYAQGLEEAEKRAVELAKLSAESDRRIAELRKAAREQVNGDCPVPAKLRELADGL